MPKIHFRFNNITGLNKLHSLEDLGSQHIAKIVSFEGIVKRRYKPRPVLDVAVFECKSCMRLHTVPQKGDEMKTPFKCDECGAQGFNFLKADSKYIDIQEVVIQDSFEKTHGRNQPMDRLLVFPEDMINQVNPGELVRVVAIIDLINEKARNGKNRNDYIAFVNNYKTLVKAFDDIEITKDDEKEIFELSKDPEIFEKFTNSVAPSIKGHKTVKEAIVCQLFGGTRKVLSDGRKMRPDIHVFIVGDPGISKTMLLQYVADFAP